MARDHRWHPHQLRHNAATLTRKVHGLDASRALLGHATMSTTEIYAEKDDAAARDAVKTLSLTALLAG